MLDFHVFGFIGEAKFTLMSACPEIIPYQDGVVAREALAEFLHQGWPDVPVKLWRQRFTHWWDENPVRSPQSHLGYVALKEGEVIGFAGGIPALFAWQGQPVQGGYATSFRVHEDYPRIAAEMFLAQRELMKEYLIVHSTPLPRIREALLKLGARAETQITCHYLALGKLACFNGLQSWPSLDPSLRVIKDLTEVHQLARPYRDAERLEKWVSLDSLKWYQASPVRKHHFVGVVDAQGTLSSFVFITPRRRKGLPAWDVVETFTTREESHELLALIGAVTQDPGLLPYDHGRLLTIADFEQEPAFFGMPALLRRQEEVCHYFLLPPAFQHVRKHTVLAEGDIGM